MNLEFFNCPDPAAISTVTLPSRPPFIDYRPKFDRIREVAERYKTYNNILIIGHGGSITSFIGIYGALKTLSAKRAYVLSTNDPDYITELKQDLLPENTLVVAISKSGETTTQIEALMQFTNYPLLFITALGSPLAKIGGKLGAAIEEHPPIGGRYTGMTEVALLSSALCGFDIEALFEGAKAVYEKYDSDNDAWRAASVFWQLEQRGFVDVFIPIYSAALFPLSNLVVQLCHESFGKDGKGQTYLAHEAPESQHHTNQRFFGGRRNMAGFIMSVLKPNHDLRTIIPPALLDLPYKDGTLKALNQIPLSRALRYELEGVLEDARIKSIPMASLQLDNISPKTLGGLLAFWQLYAVYGSVVRGVNPFDQPEVENSKKISFTKRLHHGA